MAQRTGLEPATPGVTGRYSNRLNYHSNLLRYSLSSGFFRRQLQSPRIIGGDHSGRNSGVLFNRYL